MAFGVREWQGCAALYSWPRGLCTPNTTGGGLRNNGCGGLASMLANWQAIHKEGWKASLPTNSLPNPHSNLKAKTGPGLFFLEVPKMFKVFCEGGLLP